MSRKFLLMVVAVVASLAVVSESRAAFSVTFSTAGATTVVVQDGSALDSNLTTNEITVANFSLGSYDFSGFTASSNAPSAVTEIDGIRRITSGFTVRTTGTPQGSLFVELLEDAFAFPGPTDVLVRNLIGNSTISRGNATTTTIISPGGTTSTVMVMPPAPGSASSTLLTSTSGVFTLTNRFTLNSQVSGSQFSGTSTSEVLPANSQAANPTPAPAGLLLAALGIPAFGLLRRFSRKMGTASAA